MSIPSPIVEYYDLQTGQLVCMLDNYRELSWSHAVNEVGGYYIGIYGGSPQAELIKRNQLVIVRRYNGFYWYQEWVGVQLQADYSMFSNGNTQIIFSGDDLNSFLRRRIVDYPKDTPYSSKSGYTQDVMAAYALENIGSGANNSSRRSGYGGMTGYQVATVGGSGGGAMWEGDRSGQVLLTVMRDLTKFAEQNNKPTDFRTIYNGGNIILNVYNGRYGTNRSTYGMNLTTGLNAAGQVPVVWQKALNNIDELRTKEGGAETNVIVVLGEDSSGGEQYEVVQDSSRIDGNRINRWEKEVSAPTNELDTYQPIGQEWLYDYRVANSVTATYRPGYTARYGYDWFGGDLITIVDWHNQPRHKRAMVVTATITGEGEERLDVTFDEKEFYVV